MFRDQPEPGAKVAASEDASPVPIAATTALEMIGPMPRDRHQSLAAFVLTGQRFDLAGEALNARVQAAPIYRQVFEDAQHAGRKHIGSRRQDARQLGSQETQPLPQGSEYGQPQGWCRPSPSDLSCSASLLGRQAKQLRSQHRYHFPKRQAAYGLDLSIGIF